MADNFGNSQGNEIPCKQSKSYEVAIFAWVDVRARKRHSLLALALVCQKDTNTDVRHRLRTNLGKAKEKIVHIIRLEDTRPHVDDEYTRILKEGTHVHFRVTRDSHVRCVNTVISWCHGEVSVITVALILYRSESEGEDDEDSGRESGGEAKNKNAEETPQLDLRVDGPMTGPKGVLEDYRRYRQLAAEQREEKKAELEALAKKFSITCQSSLDEEKEKSATKEFEFDEEDEFVKMYHMKRLQEMRRRAEEYVSSIRPTFGTLQDIPGKEYLDAVDKENANVVIVMHLYQPGVEGCPVMTGCLKVLSQQYPRVKFCQVLASETGISKYFVQNGLPALLVYQNKQLIGNYVKMTTIFGDDFYATDVESFLIENGILSENTPDLVTNLRSNAEDSDDSD